MTPSTTTTADMARISAHRRSIRQLGAWTTSRHFEVRASRSSVVLDLLLPRIEPGEIMLDLDLDHSMLKLLVPDGAVIDAGELRWSGKGRLKDWTGTSAPGGRTIKLLGQIRDGEVRVHRGGVAILTLIGSRRHRREVREAHREGRL